MNLKLLVVIVLALGYGAGFFFGYLAKRPVPKVPNCDVIIDETTYHVPVKAGMQTTFYTKSQNFRISFE